MTEAGGIARGSDGPAWRRAAAYLVSLRAWSGRLSLVVVAAVILLALGLFLQERWAAGQPAQVLSADGPRLGLMMSPETAEAQQAGGTWSEVVDEDGWPARLPILAWLIVLEGLALLALPLGFVAFRSLPDRGFLLTKVLALLLVCFAVWLLAGLHWMAFSRVSIGVAIAGLAAVSLFVLSLRRAEMLDFVRRRWPVLLAGEALFLAAFLAFVAVRMANPDLWHPDFGGEKPMDLAYLTATLRSTYMPPYDPWFAGGYVNYYYWGQFIVATLARATGIAPATAYNLAVSMFFALTAGAAFSLVYNMAEATLRLRSRAAAARAVRWPPVAAGLAGAAFVAVLGNLDGAIQVGRGAWRALFQDMPFGEFDFWRSSRMMPPDPPGSEITEFPFFTFLFGDLHAHMMALPFTLLVLGAALAVVLSALRPGARGRWHPADIALLALLGLATGALRALNTWDYPTYLAIAGAAVILAVFLRQGRLSPRDALEASAKVLFVVSAGWLCFLPYIRNSEAFFTSLEPTTNTTALWQFLAIHGLFVFAIGSFLLSGLRPRLSSALAWARLGLGSTRAVQAPLSALGLMALAALGYAAYVWWPDSAGSTLPFAALGLVLLALRLQPCRRSSAAGWPMLAYAGIMVAVALGLVVGLELWRVDGDVDRMNSIFKGYLQVWVLLAASSAYLLWYTLDTRLRYAPLLPRALWLVAALALIASAALYTVLGTGDRLDYRFEGEPALLTLNGEAYIDGAVYQDAPGPIDLAADFEGIRWLRDNVEGSPVVLEAVTPFYRWGGRVSVYTGLPAVLGWKWHQEQQRWGYRWAVEQRNFEVDFIYQTLDFAEALRLLHEYDVQYVYVGQVERLYYSPEGLSKFEDELVEHLTAVFDNGQTVIYRVARSN